MAHHENTHRRGRFHQSARVADVAHPLRRVHIALNGKEAVDAVKQATDQKTPYDLICMDILMPEMDGKEAVNHVRAMEQARGILSTSGVKIIMTTRRALARPRPKRCRADRGWYRTA
jgi:CheY-like chemotaxis protein